MTILLASAGMVAMILLVIGAFGAMPTKKVDLESKLKAFTRGAEIHREREKKAERGKEAFRRAASIFAGKAMTKKIEVSLAQANLLLRGEEYILLVLLATVVPGGLLLLLTGNPLLALVAAFIGFLLPKALVDRARAKRVKAFNDQLGESLVVMANSLRAGFSFFQAMEMISKEMPPPISEEFARVLREINLGASTEEALQNLLKRLPSEDLDLVITAVLTQRQVGGNLAEVMDSISTTIRERVRIQGEIRTLTAQGRISGYVIGLMPVGLAILLTIVNPEYMMGLFTHPLGMVILAAGVVSELIGFYMIRKVVDIRV